MRQQMALAGSRGGCSWASAAGSTRPWWCGLCQMAAPDGTLGVILPCHSDPQDERDALLVAGHFRVPHDARGSRGPRTDALVGALRDRTAGLAPAPGRGTEDLRLRLPLANIKPRLRMIALYFVANRLDYLVGRHRQPQRDLDRVLHEARRRGGGTCCRFGGLFKAQVRALARDLGVPQPIIDQARRAPACGSGRPTRAKWGSPTRSSRRTSNAGRKWWRPAVAMKIERLTRFERAQAEAPADLRGGGMRATLRAASPGGPPRSMPKCAHTLTNSSEGADARIDDCPGARGRRRSPDRAVDTTDAKPAQPGLRRSDQAVLDGHDPP